MAHVYILKLADDSYYVGSTNNLKQRLSYHNNKKVRSTKNKLPAKLIYQENFSTRGEAQSREYQIKRWKKRAYIEKLINMPRSSNPDFATKLRNRGPTIWPCQIGAANKPTVWLMYIF